MPQSRRAQILLAYALQNPSISDKTLGIYGDKLRAEFAEHLLSKDDDSGWRNYRSKINNERMLARNGFSKTQSGSSEQTRADIIAKKYTDFESLVAKQTAIKHANELMENEVDLVDMILKTNPTDPTLLKLKKEINDIRHNYIIEGAPAIAFDKPSGDSRLLEQGANTMLELSVDTGDYAAATTTQINVNDANGLQGTSPSSTVATGASAVSITLSVIPLVSELMRAVNYLRDAYHAQQHAHTQQRKTRIGAGLFGGLVTLGSFTVGTLFLGGVGLLATAPALLFTPIIIAAVATGVCAVAMYRDSYILNHAQKRVKDIEKTLTETQHAIDEMYAAAKADVIAECFPENTNLLALNDIVKHKIKNLNNLQTSPEVAAQLRHELKNSIKIRDLSVPSDDAEYKIKLEKATKALDNYSNPRIVGLRIEQLELIKALNSTRAYQAEARRNVILGAVSFVSFGLALAAVMATGVGALAISAIATTMFISVTVARVYTMHKEGQAAKQQMKMQLEADKIDAELSASESERHTRTSTAHLTQQTAGKNNAVNALAHSAAHAETEVVDHGIKIPTSAAESSKLRSASLDVKKHGDDESDADKRTRRNTHK